MYFVKTTDNPDRFKTPCKLLHLLVAMAMRNDRVIQND
jgi:hypothetical protein